MPTVHTRIATLADAAAIAPLFDAYRQFYDQPPDLGRAADFIRDRLGRNESTIIVAEHAEHGLVGFCQLYPTFCSVEAAPIYSLYDLFVLPAARRCGAGKVLLQAAERHATRTGAVRMDLSTARTNHAAQTLYEALGWQRDDVFYAYSKRIEPLA